MGHRSRLETQRFLRLRNRFLWRNSLRLQKVFVSAHRPGSAPEQSRQLSGFFSELNNRAHADEAPRPVNRQVFELQCVWDVLPPVLKIPLGRQRHFRPLALTALKLHRDLFYRLLDAFRGHHRRPPLSQTVETQSHRLEPKAFSCQSRYRLISKLEHSLELLLALRLPCLRRVPVSPPWVQQKQFRSRLLFQLNQGFHSETRSPGK